MGNFLTSLFRVRRTDAAATGVDKILRDAEIRLSRRDVAGTLVLLETLDGAALAATDTWRQQAKAYLEASTALQLLTQRLSTVPLRENS